MSSMESLGFKKIDVSELENLDFNPFKKIGREWFLVTAGNEKGWNTMTASWGFAGVMWGKNTFTTVIRPQRHTKEFADKSDVFTISFFKEEHKKALQFCGSHSGKDCDKAKETGLTPVFTDDTTTFAQADLVLVCKKAYVQPMAPEFFTDKSNDEKWYAAKDYHIQYIGEIVSCYSK